MLSKYRADKDKYRFQGEYLNCRNAWSLRGVEANDAGQVHVYICDLAKLPLAEQLHWKGFNEPPRGIEEGLVPFISKRALNSHFLNRWTTELEPLDQIRSILQRWNGVTWWKQRDEDAMDHVAEPLTDSIDEWSDAFLELAKLVVEGFQLPALRSALEKEAIEYTKDQKSIVLLERLAAKFLPGDKAELKNLREVQAIRSKGRSHAARTQLRTLAKKAKADFESYRNHFRSICRGVAGELQMLDVILKAVSKS